MSDAVREMVVLDPTLAEHLGKPHWHGEAWAYADELPKQELALRKPLELTTFIREMALLCEHFRREELSEPLTQKYFAIVSEKLNEEQFLEAVKAAYTAELHWAKLISFLVNFHLEQQVPAQAAYTNLSLAAEVAKKLT